MNIPPSQPFIYINPAIVSHLIQGFQGLGSSPSRPIVLDLNEQMEQEQVKRPLENDEDWTSISHWTSAFELLKEEKI